MIRAIVAVDDRNGIAVTTSAASYSIPWNIPDDRQYYRQKTEHSVVVMGRETYSLFEHPLPDRKNVVVSRSAHSVRDGFELVHNVDQFLRNASEDVWIIGGAALYESVLPYCQELYVTQVAGDYGCDHFFPDFIHDYSLQKSSPLHTQNGYTYQFTVYSKNR